MFFYLIPLLRIFKYIMSHIIVYYKYYSIPAINFIFGIEVLLLVNILIYFFNSGQCLSRRKKLILRMLLTHQNKQRMLWGPRYSVPSESDQTEGYESELDPSGGGREKAR